MSGKLMVVVSVCFLLAFSVYAEERASIDFEGVLYNCDAIPSEATPVWDIGIISTSPAPAASGGILNIDTMAGGAAAWYLPGAYGAESAPLENRNYVNGDPNNPWNPDAALTGYTLEAKFQMLNSLPGQWGFSFYIGEAYGQCLSNLQIFTDKIVNSDQTTVYYTGDLSDKMHTLRLVRHPGTLIDPFSRDDISMDLYIDGVLVYTLLPYHLGGTMVGSGPYQDWLYAGSLSGSARYEVDIDYIRMDFTGTYTPPAEEATCGDFGYLKGDFNKDCVVSILDLEALALTWLECTDPTDPACLNCNDPANAELCK